MTTQYDVRVAQTNANVKVDILDNTNIDIPLPAVLANAVLNFSFELDGLPVTEDIEGSLLITGRYKNGRVQSITTIDLSDTDTYDLVGKYTSINFALSDLVGADKVIVNVDQNINIV